MSTTKVKNTAGRDEHPAVEARPAARAPQSAAARSTFTPIAESGFLSTCDTGARAGGCAG